jgi:hypothetical protein
VLLLLLLSECKCFVFSNLVLLLMLPSKRFICCQLCSVLLLTSADIVPSIGLGDGLVSRLLQFTTPKHLRVFFC